MSICISVGARQVITEIARHIGARRWETNRSRRNLESIENQPYELDFWGTGYKLGLSEVLIKAKTGMLMRRELL